jgi:hypothetical protein
MIVLAVAVLGVAATLVMRRQGRSHRSGAWARPLHWGALLTALAAAVAVFPTTWADSGVFALLLLGVPVVFAADTTEPAPRTAGNGGFDAQDG